MDIFNTTIVQYWKFCKCGGTHRPSGTPGISQYRQFAYLKNM